MNYKIETIPCLSDNYAFLIIEESGKKAMLIDAPESGPILKHLEINGLSLDYILLTHHHDDHILGVSDLVKKYDCKVLGASDDAHRLPKLNMQVKGDDSVNLSNLTFKVFDVPGHTVGHIAFYCEEIKALFSGDSLMALGCGRLFEGTPKQMWESLKTLKSLDPQTMVYSGHEYTENNGVFCLTIEPENMLLKSRVQKINQMREANMPTIPSLLSDELNTNSFLRAELQEVKSAMNLDGSSALDVFTEIRKRKDNF